MNIVNVIARIDCTLVITTSDGKTGKFDVRPYLGFAAFKELSDSGEFMKIRNGGYYVEWQNGADLSADTIEAKMLPL